MRHFFRANWRELQAEAAPAVEEIDVSGKT